jgi:hypothetical protein
MAATFSRKEIHICPLLARLKCVVLSGNGDNNKIEYTKKWHCNKYTEMSAYIVKFVDGRSKLCSPLVGITGTLIEGLLHGMDIALAGCSVGTAVHGLV